MTETTARVRWEPLLGGNFDGYVGRLTSPMFEVQAVAGNTLQPWALRSDLLAGYSTGTDPDELMAEAERWLEGFDGMVAIEQGGARDVRMTAAAVSTQQTTEGETMPDPVTDLARQVQHHVAPQPWGYHGDAPVPVEITYHYDSNNPGRDPWRVRYVTGIKNGKRTWGRASGASIAAALDAARADQLAHGRHPDAHPGRQR